MPFIRTTTNISIPKEIELKLKEEYGNAISIMGKIESWLMLEFDDNKKMYFQGNSEKPIAYVDIKVFGSVSNADEMTRAVSTSLNTYLNIPLNQIYVSYSSFTEWGYNGNNF